MGQDVTRTGNALDLEPGVFTWPNPRDIALSLKRSAERSARRRSDPFRSAMSMLTFYINRAGNNLDSAQRERLEAYPVVALETSCRLDDVSVA